MYEEKIKRILEREIKKHREEAIKHKKLADKRISKKEKMKSKKHWDKHSQTINIANQMGFKICECCGGLR